MEIKKKKSFFSCSIDKTLIVCCSCIRYHMECLNPPLSEIPVDEWFCPACAPANAAVAAAGKYFDQITLFTLILIVENSCSLKRCCRVV